MEKVGIITLYGLFNYGNRLQNYAVQKIFTEWGFETKSFTYAEPEAIDKITYIKYCIHKLTNYKFTRDIFGWKYYIGRRLEFIRFQKKYLPTEMIDSLEGLKNRADYFVVGSDQVWNPWWYDDNPMKKDLYLLTFAEKHQKVCFSPSFGVDKMPEEWIPWFRKCLNEFDNVSVREDTGAKLVAQVAGKESTVLIDPTLMLTAKDWLQIAKRPKRFKCSGKYILTYFLGEKSGRVNEDVEKLGKQLGVPVYNLLDSNEVDIYSSGPCEFIYLIAHSLLVLTDSFHASVFSFIFQKPFLVYPRVGDLQMGSRISSLLYKFGMERKYVDSGLPNEVLECDYSNGWEVLKHEQKKVIKFLGEAMGRRHLTIRGDIDGIVQK